MSVSSISPNEIQLGPEEDSRVKKLRKTVTENSHDNRLWYQRGSYLRILGRNEEAEDALREAIMCKPDNIKAWTELALLFEQNQRIHDANTAWNAVETLRAEFPEVIW